MKPSRQEVYLTCSRTDADLSGPAAVPGDNNGCSKGLRSNSVTGSLTPRQNRSPCRPHPQYRFIQPGAPREWELSPRFWPRHGPLVSRKTPVVMRPSHRSVIEEPEAGTGEHGGTVARMLHPRRRAWVSPLWPRPSIDARVGGGWPEACSCFRYADRLHAGVVQRRSAGRRPLARRLAGCRRG